MSDKHAHSGGPSGGVNLNIIITPMLDMAFQLLAFFIMTYHPSALEAHIGGNLLPAADRPNNDGGKPAAKPENLLPAHEDPQFDDAVRVKVKSVPKGLKEGDLWDGEPRWIEIYRPEAAAPIIVSGNRNVQADPADRVGTAREAWVRAYVKTLETELTGELKKILREPGATSANIKLEADADLKHRYWMKFYDTCKRSGFDKIHFVAPVVSRNF